jgi:hypothetical protein
VSIPLVSEFDLLRLPGIAILLRAAEAILSVIHVSVYTSRKARETYAWNDDV